MAETWSVDSVCPKNLLETHIFEFYDCKSWFRAQKRWKTQKISKSFLVRSDFTDVFIKKLAYIRFHKLVTSYDLVPGGARHLERFRRYGSRKVWDVWCRTDFIRPRIFTKFYVVNGAGVAVVFVYFEPKYVSERWNTSENVFSFSYTTKTAPGHRWSQLVTSGHTWSHLVTCQSHLATSILPTAGHSWHLLVTNCGI